MATRKKRVRFTMDINFTSEAEKDAFCSKLGEVRDKLTPRGSTLNNQEFLLALFELVGSTESTTLQHVPSSGTFLRNSGLCSFCYILE